MSGLSFLNFRSSQHSADDASATSSGSDQRDNPHHLVNFMPSKEGGEMFLAADPARRFAGFRDGALRSPSSGRIRHHPAPLVSMYLT